jgi:hypothetical protein
MESGLLDMMSRLFDVGIGQRAVIESIHEILIHFVFLDVYLCASSSARTNAKACGPPPPYPDENPDLMAISCLVPS